MPANGKWPADQLVVVEDNDKLRATAANSFFRMRDAAARDGVRLQIAEPAGAYRSLQVQQDMHDHPSRYNLNPASKVRLAAVGYSGHGDANCIDVVGTGAIAWMLRNGPGFGWFRPFGGADPNHFRHNGTTAATAVRATPITISRSRMYVIQITKNDINDPTWPLGQYLVLPTGITRTTVPIARSVNRLNGIANWLDYKGVPQYSSEVKALDTAIRTA